MNPTKNITSLFPPASILICRKPGNLISEAICFASREDDGIGMASHVALMDFGNTIIESTFPYTKDKVPVDKYLSPEYETIIADWERLDSKQRFNIISSARKHIGEVYPFWYLSGFAIDLSLTRLLRFMGLLHPERQVTWFVKCMLRRQLVCSQLVAQALNEGLGDVGKYLRFGRECVKWYEANPDHFYEDIWVKPKWKILYNSYNEKRIPSR
ncbi:hypothetical protein J7M23_09075 [Candidatus Sumerlaeota bacterium]|nr:hypothetical protein [Candidatus Sumerlaeota bacterium]